MPQSEGTEVLASNLARTADWQDEAELSSRFYHRNLIDPEITWGVILRDELLAIEDGELVSRGPWLIDTNHRESGLLLGPAYIRTCRVDGLPFRPNLANASLRLVIHFAHRRVASDPDFLTSGKLQFWFQHEFPPAFAGAPARIVNYAFNQNLLEAALNGTPVDLSLNDSLDDWTCLGRDQSDVRPTIGSAAKYTSALNINEFREALRGVNCNMGLILRLPSPPQQHDWLSPSQRRTPALAESQLRLSEFTIIPADGVAEDGAEIILRRIRLVKKG